MIVWLADRNSKPTAEAAQPVERPSENGRETFDQLVYAFLLLIVGRAFLLEPFVIPTGSMAPTLYGRHKECVCDSCGFHYQVGASSEVDATGSYLIGGSRILIAHCPNCRKPNDIKDAPAFSGDRVTVNKWAYSLGRPSRFDVFVFKYPEEAARNYIKRLVGLPGETITIRGGDLYLHTEGGQQILRKDHPRKRRAMTQLVHDNSVHSIELAKAGWPSRWNLFDENSDPADPARTGSTGEQSTIEVTPSQTLRYTHWAPTIDDWLAVQQGQPVSPKARLIADYCFYNAYRSEGDSDSGSRCGRGRYLQQTGLEVSSGNFWVPDIGFECDVDLSSDVEVLTLELVEGVTRYRCHINCKSGDAELTLTNVKHDAKDERPLATASTPLRAGRNHSLRFSNIDDELVLWIDGSPVSFGDGGQYERTLLDDALPTRADLSPIGLSVSSGSAVVESLKVFRDVYYLAEHGPFASPPSFWCDLEDQLDDPDTYAATYAAASEEAKTLTVESGPDGYLAFGDNSPRSNDSRLWRTVNAVPSSHLVGKAFWIYWPHPIPFLNNGHGINVWPYVERGIDGVRKVPDYSKYSVPFYPQFSRMTRIR